MREKSEILDNRIRLLYAHIVELRDMLPTYKGTPSVSLIRDQILQLQIRVKHLLAEAAEINAFADSTATGVSGSVTLPS